MELAREIKLIDCSMAGTLSNRSSGVQILGDICTRLKRYLYSAKCSWIIRTLIIRLKWSAMKSRILIGFLSGPKQRKLAKTTVKLTRDLI